MLYGRCHALSAPDAPRHAPRRAGGASRPGARGDLNAKDDDMGMRGRLRAPRGGRSARVVAGAALVLLIAAGPPAAGSTAASAPSAVPTGPYSVDVGSREDVRQFYDTAHESTSGLPGGWTGDIASCAAGSVSPDYLAATL